MGRSQRHKVLVQGTDSAGKGLSEKQPAIVYIQQYAASQAFSIPIGPAGGPLKNSSMAGYPPTLIPPPGLLAARDAELREGEGEFTEPGQFNLSGNPIHTDLPAPEEGGGVLPPPDGGGGETPPEPEPGFEPTLVSIAPDTADITAATVITVTGTNFTDTSVVTLDGAASTATDYVSDTELTTSLPADFRVVAGTMEVGVMQGTYTTTTIPFTWTEAAPPEPPIEETQQVEFPYGPFNLVQVEDVGDTLRFHLGERITVAPGNIIVIEATGTTTVNGSYEVKTVAFGAAGTVIVVDNPGVDLPAAIDNRGRLTVIGAA